MLEVGDTVRIVKDEYPRLIGVVGTLKEFSDDLTVAWVVFNDPFGAWCGVSNLEKV